MNHKRAAKGAIISVVLLGLFSCMILNLQFALQGKFFQDKSALADISEAVLQQPVLPDQKPAQFDGSQISAKSAVVAETDAFGVQKIIFSKNSSEKFPIASITKLMTAIVVLENYDFSEKIAMSGQDYSTEQLFNIMLIESNNESAEALAGYMGREKFIGLMNQKANELELASTHFENPTGLDSGNISSAEDLAKMLNYIMQSKPLVFAISQKKEYSLYDFSGNFVRQARNTDRLLEDAQLETRIVGGKTGLTPDAGQCLALALKTVDGKKFLLNIILGSENRFGEMKKLIDFADKNL